MLLSFNLTNQCWCAVANITVNTKTGDVIGNLRTTNLGDASAAHIHTGFAGTNGSVLIGFVQDAFDIALWELPVNKSFTPEQLTQLNAGGLYYNLHTPANPAGEVRGQIVPTGIIVARAILQGDQEVPAVSTLSSGIGYVTVNTGTGDLIANVRTTGLNDATAAHIHQGDAGNNGSVIVGLTQDAADTAIWSSDADAKLTNSQLTAFTANGLYFNVHSQAIGSGEIRGQITPQ